MILNKNTLGKIIRYFKARTTKNIRDEKEYIDFSWQRNYYDRIIRNEIELNKIREYIIKNPEMWENDENNLSVIAKNRHACGDITGAY